MNPTKLTLENLKQLDHGIIPAAFNKEIERIVEDCKDRPTDDRPREVVLKIKMAPKVDAEAGDVNGDEILVDAEISSVVPKRRTKVYTMKPQGKSAIFHPDLPDDPDESMLYDEDVRGRERGDAA